MLLSRSLCCDSVEAVPFNGALADIVAVGHYELLDDRKTKVGQIALLQRNISSTPDKPSFDVIQEVDGDAIFDMKWNPVLHDGSALLAQANVTGEVVLSVLSETKQNEKNQVPTFALKKLHAIEASTSAALSLAWSPHSPQQLLTSTSNGFLAVLDTQDVKVMSTWKAHDYETWITEWGSAEHVLYSGADDMIFKRWDDRVLSVPTFVNKTTHAAGVTVIASHPREEHMLVTGSYDEYVRMWDARKLTQPTREMHVGGGVWRLRWHPEKSNILLCAAMHNGFHVLDVSKEEWAENDIVCTSVVQEGDEGEPIVLDVAVCQSFKEHKSLAYGCDWVRPSEAHSYQGDIASCSFYDKEIRAWHSSLS